MLGASAPALSTGGTCRQESGIDCSPRFTVGFPVLPCRPAPAPPRPGSQGHLSRQSPRIQRRIAPRRAVRHRPLGRRAGGQGDRGIDPVRRPRRDPGPRLSGVDATQFGCIRRSRICEFAGFFAIFRCLKFRTDRWAPLHLRNRDPVALPCGAQLQVDFA